MPAVSARISHHVCCSCLEHVFLGSLTMEGPLLSFSTCEAFGCLWLVFVGMGCLIYFLGSSCVHLFCNVSTR